MNRGGLSPGESMTRSSQDPPNGRSSSGAQSLGISVDQLARLQHLAEQSSTDRLKADSPGVAFIPEYGATLGADLVAPICYVPERRSSWAPEPRKSSGSHEEEGINSNTGTVYRTKGAPDITISAMPTSHSAHNVSPGYRRGSDVVHRRRPSDNENTEEFDEAFEQYKARERRRKSSSMWRKDETLIDSRQTLNNFIAVSCIIVAIVSGIIALKLLYF